MYATLAPPVDFCYFTGPALVANSATAGGKVNPHKITVRQNFCDRCVLPFGLGAKSGTDWPTPLVKMGKLAVNMAAAMQTYIRVTTRSNNRRNSPLDLKQKTEELLDLKKSTNQSKKRSWAAVEHLP